MNPLTALLNEFYSKYGGEEQLAMETASPQLGNLNSGMQLYWLKYKKLEMYSQIACSLHLPQYITYVLCGSLYSDITSIGCHTNLWDFEKNDYHTWVYEEGIDKKLVPLFSSSEIAGYTDSGVPVGVGSHDSSAALIPYVMAYQQPFVLLSTGTWSISLNPFNDSLLTNRELKQDCLIYLSYEGNPVKAARLFAGYEHELQTKRLAAHFSVSPLYFHDVRFDASLCKQLQRKEAKKTAHYTTSGVSETFSFSNHNLSDFETPEEAYHQLMLDIIGQQVTSTQLVIHNAPVEKLFVDGGFSKNDVYMNLLASGFPRIEVYSAQIAQASALGAAIAISEACNSGPLPQETISLTRFEPLAYVGSE